MKMKILFLFFVASVIFLTFFSILSENSFKLNFHLLEVIKNSNWMFQLSLMCDLFTCLFMLTVCVVTMVVLSFSEKYMEMYNISKFLKLKMMFFLSMIFLLESDSMLNFSMGWDYLGFSSIFLIMMYPNKNTLSNSILTMFYNRVGDILILMSMSILLFSYFTSVLEMNLFVLNFTILMLICSFTKSAQFPLNSWLPAAMSAPTPISAMVHSSTLVTAGIFLNYKMFSSISEKMILLNMIYLFMFTCLSGSAMAYVEVDIKKMVAFSTMSQISFIMVLLFMKMKLVTLMHLIYHAFFKTLIFISAGFNFIGMMSGQSSILNWNSKYFLLLKVMFFISLFSMIGLNFSSSFMSKHLAINCMFIEYNSVFPLYFIILSMFTIFYSCKILKNVLPSKTSKIKFSSTKKFNSTLILFFSLLNALIYMVSKEWLNLKHFTMGKEDFLIISLLLTGSCFFKMIFKNSYILQVSFEVFFSKFIFLFSGLKIIMKKLFKEVTINDKMIMEESMNLTMKNVLNFNSHFFIYLLISILGIIFAHYSFSLSERDIEDIKDLE